MDARDIKIRRRLAKVQLPTVVATTIVVALVGYAAPYPADSWGAAHRLGAVGLGASCGFFLGASLLLIFYVPYRYWVALAVVSVVLDFVPSPFHWHADPGFTPWLAPIFVALGFVALVVGRLIRHRTERALSTGA